MGIFFQPPLFLFLHLTPKATQLFLCRWTGKI
jgi:hypothetical protein